MEFFTSDAWSIQFGISPRTSVCSIYIFNVPRWYHSYNARPVRSPHVLDAILRFIEYYGHDNSHFSGNIPFRQKSSSDCRPKVMLYCPDPRTRYLTSVATILLAVQHPCRCRVRTWMIFTQREHPSINSLVDIPQRPSAAELDISARPLMRRPAYIARYQCCGLRVSPSRYYGPWYW